MRIQFPLVRHTAILASVLLFTLVGCDATVRSVTREAKPLTYVGQVQLGKPTTNEGGRVVVPLKYNGGEWGENSAIVPVDVKAAVKDTEINITVVTSVATNSNDKDGYELVLPEHTTGKYEVFYRDPTVPGTTSASWRSTTDFGTPSTEAVGTTLTNVQSSARYRLPPKNDRASLVKRRTNNAAYTERGLRVLINGKSSLRAR